MLVKPGDVVRFLAYFQSLSTGLGVSGLTVKVAVNRGTTNVISVASSTSASPLDATNQPGWYYYDYTVPAGYYGDLEASFTTTDTSVLLRGAASLYLSALWVVYAAQANRDVNLTQWKGGTPYDLQGGKVDVYASALADALLADAKFASDFYDAVKVAVWEAAERTLTDFGFTPDANLASINGSAASAQKLAVSADTMLTGAVGAGATVTDLPTDLTETETHQYKGRILIFTSGAFLRRAVDIVDYDGATKTIYVPDLGSAPAEGDTFIIV